MRWGVCVCVCVCVLSVCLSVLAPVPSQDDVGIEREGRGGGWRVLKASHVVGAHHGCAYRGLRGCELSQRELVRRAGRDGDLGRQLVEHHQRLPAVALGGALSTVRKGVGAGRGALNGPDQKALGRGGVGCAAARQGPVDLRRLEEVRGHVIADVQHLARGGSPARLQQQQQAAASAHNPPPKAQMVYITPHIETPCSRIPSSSQ
jgi:hypothetical protein